MISTMAQSTTLASMALLRGSASNSHANEWEVAGDAIGVMSPEKSAESVGESCSGSIAFRV